MSKQVKKLQLVNPSKLNNLINKNQMVSNIVWLDMENSINTEAIKVNYLKQQKPNNKQTQQQQQEDWQDQNTKAHAITPPKLMISQMRLQRTLNIKNIKGENRKIIDITIYNIIQDLRRKITRPNL